MRRGRERRREEGERAGPCVRVSERVWRGGKKKGSDGELAAFCPRSGSRAATFHVDVISDGDEPPAQGCCLRHTGAFLWASRGSYSLSCSVISDAIGSISKVKPSFVEASARRAPPRRRQPQGPLTLRSPAGRSKLGRRDFSQPPQLGWVFPFFFAFVSGTSPRITRLAGEFLSNYRGGRRWGAVCKKGI